MFVFKQFLYKMLAYITALFISFSGSVPFFGCGGDIERPDNIEQCKIVIFLIGDGMGFNSIEMAEQYLGRELSAFDGFELYGSSQTAPATPLFTTDSAAGGTALATGERVSIKTVGVYPDDTEAKNSYPMNLCELAISLGKAAGIVTTADTWDATPADFSAHVSYRENYEEIQRQQAESGLTLLWGQKSEDMDIDLMRDNGYEIIWGKDDMDALAPGSRSFGMFGYNFKLNGRQDGQATYLETITKAIDLLDDDEDGFFLMFEAAHIDKYSDEMNGKMMSMVMEGFDEVIQYALDYAKADGNTLVVLTADHETGGIKKFGNKYIYTTTQHTGVDVPLFVYGCNNFINDGESIENREVGIRTAMAMGELNFPIDVKR